MSTQRDRFLAAPDMVYFVVAFTPDGSQVPTGLGPYVDKVRAHELAKAEAGNATAYVVGAYVSYIAEVQP